MRKHTIIVVLLFLIAGLFNTAIAQNGSLQYSVFQTPSCAQNDGTIAFTYYPQNSGSGLSIDVSVDGGGGSWSGSGDGSSQISGQMNNVGA